MKKLRIGVWLNDNFKPETGGVYGYYTKLINTLNKYPFKNAEIVFLSDKKNNQLKNKTIKWRPAKSKILKAILNLAKKLNPLFKNLINGLEKSMSREINELRNEIYQYADVIYYPSHSCVYPDFPYIYTLWDLGHLSSYAFPELTMDGNFEVRKNRNDICLSQALMIFAESETGKKQCEKYYNINEKRIKAIPLFPSDVVSPGCLAKKPAKLAGGDFFIHYPAQFWAHKNHYNLLLAMTSIIKMFPDLKLILTGSDKGNKTHILNTVAELRLEKNVIDLGFVSLGELRWLYENSRGLVMPTLLGPTNMPLLEAAELGCPVACTNFSGHMEQLGDYGYYFDGIDPNDIARQVIAMINDKKNGVIKNYVSKFNLDNTMKAIDEAFGELKQIRFCWGK